MSEQSPRPYLHTISQRLHGENIEVDFTIFEAPLAADEFYDLIPVDPYNW